MMTVQMVLCDVEDRAYLRAELVNSLQLKAADLRNSYGNPPLISNDLDVYAVPIFPTTKYRFTGISP